MTEHLPECPISTKDTICRCLPCICDALRACEERVDESSDRAWFDVVFSAGYKAGYSAGYKKAVADAQWLLEEHVDSTGWIALAKMKPNND